MDYLNPTSSNSFPCSRHNTARTFCSDGIEDSEVVDGIEGCGGDVLNYLYLKRCTT